MADVNGTRYHLLYGLDDWRGSQLVLDDGASVPLRDLLTDSPERNPHVPLEWHVASGSLRLAQQIPIFRHARPARPLDLARRRGAGRDRYGTWYWIDPSESSIRWLPAGTRRVAQWWSSADLARRCILADATTFAPCLEPAPPTLLLRGLVVTTRHYLVVGDVTRHGLLVFDLHRGGGPLLLRWPDDVPFLPWDLAPTPDGGVLVLDRDNLTYWALDADFRLLAEVDPDQPALFQPRQAGAPTNVVRGAAHPWGYPLAGGSPAELPLSPVSIESGPQGSALILDTDPARPYSIIYEYQAGDLVATYSLEDAVEAADPRSEAGEMTLFSVAGHDFAYVETGEPQAAPRHRGNCGCRDQAALAAVAGSSSLAKPPTRTIYVAERNGDQAFAFTLDHQARTLADRHEFLPLRRWGAKALVAADGQAYYDVGERWVPLAVLTECRYAGRAVFTTPTDFRPDRQGQPFDGGLPGCVWHRLFLDAQIPVGTAITVRARAADEPDFLAQTSWLPQPTPYLRGGGSEIPFYNPWADLRAGAQPFPERTGTWEFLFQGVRGRYLQLEVTLLGTGRSTPLLRALRAWYPRFSYSEHYLPAIYREEPVSASFLERWLANVEGFYTDLEDRIEHVAALFSPDTAPPEALDWLACWFGLALDPLWDERRRRFFIRHADQLFRWRGTLSGVEAALRLYLDCRVDESLLPPLARDAGRVRIVERFRTRGVGGLAYGDPTDTGSQTFRALTRHDVAASAHWFTVLVPHDLSDEERDMVERLVRLEKPAHTAYELKRFWDLFRVGEARLGLDTRLGESSRFAPFRLGESYLPEAYLEAPYPFDIADRLVLDRDRLGDLPAL